MKQHAIATLELLNRRRLARMNFITDYLGGSYQNRRKEIGDLKDTEYLARFEPHGDGRLERAYPHFFHRIYAKGTRADKALKAAGIQPIKHPDTGDQFWHQMFIDDIVLSFEIACKQKGIPFKDQYEILGDKPLELPCHISYTFGTGKTHKSDRALGPDALFAIGDTYFALEADRGTEPIERSNLEQTSYLRKFLQYRDVLKNKTYLSEWGIPNLMVLHISNRQDRTDALSTYLAEELKGKSESQCFKAAPALASTAKAPRPLTTLLTDPYERVGHPPYTIGKR
jgi:hypothetical protein